MLYALCPMPSQIQNFNSAHPVGWLSVLSCSPRWDYWLKLSEMLNKFYHNSFLFMVNSGNDRMSLQADGLGLARVFGREIECDDCLIVDLKRSPVLGLDESAPLAYVDSGPLNGEI